MLRDSRARLLFFFLTFSAACTNNTTTVVEGNGNDGGVDGAPPPSQDAAPSSGDAGATPDSNGSADTGGSPDSGGSPGSDAASSGCADITGIWSVIGSCGGDVCNVTENACAVTLLCSQGSVSYSGTVTSTTVTYSGKNGSGVQATCNGTLSGTSSISGTCTTAQGNCSFSATKH